MYKLRQTKRFQKDFGKLVKKRQNLILEKLSILASGNWDRLDLKKLKGSDNSYRIRSGNYRILFEKRESELVIILISVKHRKEAYL